MRAAQALFRALKTKHATPKYGLIYHASLIGQAAPKIKGKISRSLAAKTALAIRYDALGDGQDNTMGLENRAKLEARLRVLEGRELGRSAGSTKGKPKIEVYDKDRKKGAGALITPAKTYNPSADLLLSRTPEPASNDGALTRKRKHEEAEPAPAQDETKERGDDGEKRKKKKKTEVENIDSQANVVEEPEKKKKKKKNEVESADVEQQEGGAAGEADRKKDKKKKKRQAEGEEQETETVTKKEKKKKEKKKD